MFPRMPYLEWIWGRPAAATHDLGSSDLRPRPDRDPVIPASLEGLADPEDPPSLERSIADEYGVDPSQVLVTAGATHANFVAAATALGADDEASDVLVEKPGYGPLVHTPAGLGARVTRFGRTADDGYGLSPARVAAAADDGTALVTVTNRHNPTGRLVDRDALADVADAAATVDAPLLVDEVYAPYVGESDGRRGFGGVTAAGLPNAVVTGSLTKFHGLGGLKVGWIVGPESFVERATRVFVHVPAVAAPSRALAGRFFANRDHLMANVRDHLRRNRDFLASFVADRPDLSGEIFEGCTFGLVAHERADGDRLAEAAWDAGVLVVPGRFFGEPDAVRLSAGRAPETVADGLSALGAVLDDL